MCYVIRVTFILFGVHLFAEIDLASTMESINYDSLEDEDEFDIMMLALILLRKKEKRNSWVGNLCQKREEFGAFHHIHSDLNDSEFR